MSRRARDDRRNGHDGHGREGEEAEHGGVGARHRPQLLDPADRRRPAQPPHPVADVGGDAQEHGDREHAPRERLRRAAGRRDLGRERAERREQRRGRHDPGRHEGRLPRRHVARERRRPQERDCDHKPHRRALEREGAQHGREGAAAADGAGEDELVSALVLLAAQRAHRGEERPGRGQDGQHARGPELDVAADARQVVRDAVEEPQGDVVRERPRELHPGGFGRVGLAVPDHVRERIQHRDRGEHGQTHALAAQGVQHERPSRGRRHPQNGGRSGPGTAPRASARG